MIRVGITFNPNQPLWYSGLNQTAFVLLELCQYLNYDCTLLDYTNGEQEWFTDYPMPSVPVLKLHQATPLSFDLLIDIDGKTSEAARVCTKKTIVFLRTFMQFTEMDSQLYIESPYVPRCMNQVTEIWCWDILNPPETIPSIQTMFPCPIRRVPFIWSSTIPRHYQQPIAHDPEKPWTIHVAEKNTTNTSSSIIPLVAVREVPVSLQFRFAIHNMDHIKENRFLKENVLTPIMADTLPITFEPKEPWYSWTSNDILLSHSRFVPVRLGLLNAVWLGIPLVHNSPFLKDLCPSLAATYYEGNSIQQIVARLTECKKHLSDNIVKECQNALDAYSIVNQTEWKSILEQISNQSTVSYTVTDTTSPLIIAFDDMWPGFNYHTNFIMDALRNEQPKRSIKGMLYDKDIRPHLLIFGPYSQNWKSIDVPKVYFSGENWPHPVDPSISLFLSSSPVEDASHMRVPTWMHFIDWYSTETGLPSNQEDNPIRLPLSFAMTSNPIPFEERKQFCAFVVSNPICSLRNDAFHHLNQYKPVSSGGAYQNNIGGQLHLKYPGGGCGDISKHHFFADHKFTISFENSQAPGYLTEKLLHAKMAGCVPLYWGDSVTDFDPQSFINLSHMTSAKTIVDIIKKLEANPAMCKKIASTPPLDEQRKQTALQTISAMSRRLLQLASSPSIHTYVYDPIDKIMMINLDSRPDRMQSFVAAHPDITVTRFSAINGKNLQMSTELVELCKHNTFQWKKSVIACAFSHITVWNQIATGTATHTLVLEDDVRFVEGWRDHIKDIPADAELLYLGGVLPANRHVLPHALEKVNEYWSQIKPNTFFSKEPSLNFHFCAYSYILTKRGAQKLLDYLTHSVEKLCVPGDHLLGHPGIGLKKYVTSTLLTTCFQEADPQYNDAQFNELQTEKKFDSDIYNNTECFDISAFIKKEPLQLHYLGHVPELYEQTGLEDMFQKPLTFVPYSDVPDAWCLVQRPHEWATLLATRTTPFHVLHLSDEFGTDEIGYYAKATKVIRTYHRDNLPQHVHVIPLGYHHKSSTVTPIQERKLVWSFHGTDWFHRAVQLQHVIDYVPHHCKLQKEWNDPAQTKKGEYLSDLGNSRFCPVLRGNNAETFRLYEALEAGTLPIALEINDYTEWIDKHLKLSELYEWTSPRTMKNTMTEEIQKEVVKRWNMWKEDIKRMCRT